MRSALDLPEELDVFASFQEGEEKPYSAEVELEAQRLQALLGDEAERVPAEQERAEMFQEFWDEGCGAEVDDEAYDWATDESHISDQEAAPAHDCMQGPTSARGHEEEAKAAATGHGQALPEAQSSATGQRRKDDKHVVINLTSGKRFKAASKHGLPFVAFTRSESFAMTAFKNLPPWGDFQKASQ